MKITENIKIMQAFLQGKTIESKKKVEISEDWREDLTPIWNFNDIEYRIKPLQIRPYTPKELIEAIKTHGPILRYKEENYYYTITNFGVTTVGMVDNYEGEFFNYSIEDVIKDYTWADDESPFGIIEEYK